MKRIDCIFPVREILFLRASLHSPLCGKCLLFALRRLHQVQINRLRQMSYVKLDILKQLILFY